VIGAKPVSLYTLPAARGLNLDNRPPNFDPGSSRDIDVGTPQRKLDPASSAGSGLGVGVSWTNLDVDDLASVDYP